MTTDTELRADERSGDGTVEGSGSRGVTRSAAYHAAAETTLRFAGVLFDLDGTLVDTLPDLTAAVNAMRADVAMPPITDRVVATYVGKGVAWMVARALAVDGGTADDATARRGLARFRVHYAPLNGRHSRLFAGVREGLDAFRESGARLAIVTNKSTEFTWPLLRHMELDGYFDAVVCGDTCARGKPDPMPLQHACALLRVKPQDALFIGDSINDAAAARAAGIPMLAVPYGYRGGASVQSLHADDTVASILAAARWAASTSARANPA